jgi:hypothetical protein
MSSARTSPDEMLSVEYEGIRGAPVVHEHVGGELPRRWISFHGCSLRPKLLDASVVCRHYGVNSCNTGIVGCPEKAPDVIVKLERIPGKSYARAPDDGEEQGAGEER